MEPVAHPSVDALIRLPEVLRLIPISRSAWYKGIAEGRYPRSIKLSERAVAWRRFEIEALMERLQAQSRPLR